MFMLRPFSKIKLSISIGWLDILGIGFMMGDIEIEKKK